MGTGLVCLENSVLVASAQDTGSQSLASAVQGSKARVWIWELLRRSICKVWLSEQVQVAVQGTAAVCGLGEWVGKVPSLEEQKKKGRFG